MEIIIKIIQNAWKYARKTILLSPGEYWQLIQLYLITTTVIFNISALTPAVAGKCAPIFPGSPEVISAVGNKKKK